MSNLNSQDLADTNSTFYSNVDRLIKIIDITIQKGQGKNAERYLKYLFEVFVKYYFKISQTNPESTFATQSYGIISESSETDTIFSIFQNTISRRNVHLNSKDYFIGKINHILIENIKSNKYEIFHFILRLYQDSLLFLLNNAQTSKTAIGLIYNFKFIADKILTLTDHFSMYERSWFQSELFEWFIQFYSSSKYEGSYMQAVENEILYINKSIIDNGKLGLFKKFISRLSSSSFISNYLLDKSIQELLPKDQLKSRKILNNIRSKIYDNYQLKTLNEFLDFLKDLDEAIKTEMKGLNYDDSKTKELIDLFNQKAFEEFKKSNLKIILVKLIVYSFFKKEVAFFQAYLQYHQPPDSDATWASNDYSIKYNSEIVFLLTHENDILDKTFFWIDHHGFSIYLNTFIGYYLYTFEKNKLANLPIVENYGIASIVHYRLEQIKTIIDKSLLEKLIKNFDINLYEEILTKYIEWAKTKQETIKFKETYEAEVSKKKIDQFINSFVESYNKSSIIKNIFKLNDRTEDVKEFVKEKTLGINQLINKSVFIERSNFDVTDFPDSFASELAQSEDIDLMIKLETNAQRIELKKKDFYAFITNNKNRFNIILSKGRYINSYDFPDLNFTEAWALENSIYKNVSDFLGVLDSHYHVFFIRGFPQEEYTFLNLDTIGKINQYIPKELPEGILEYPFRFSFLDFKNHEVVLQEQLKNKEFDRQRLLENIWLRIFESFEFLPSESPSIIVKVSAF